MILFAIGLTVCHMRGDVAMVAWVLEYLGRDDVHIMDVVFDEWKAKGRDVLYRPVPRVPRQFTIKVNPGVRVRIDDISGVTDLKLVDSRSLEEYNGESEADEKPGHIASERTWQRAT